VCYLGIKGKSPGRNRGILMWAHVDLNHGPHPYQGCALTGLSYGPRLVVKDHAV
jgi:hypothetical protein